MSSWCPCGSALWRVHASSSQIYPLGRIAYQAYQELHDERSDTLCKWSSRCVVSQHPFSLACRPRYGYRLYFRDGQWFSIIPSSGSEPVTLLFNVGHYKHSPTETRCPAPSNLSSQLIHQWLGFLHNVATCQKHVAFSDYIVRLRYIKSTVLTKNFEERCLANWKFVRVVFREQIILDSDIPIFSSRFVINSVPLPLRLTDVQQSHDMLILSDFHGIFVEFIVI